MKLLGGMNLNVIFDNVEDENYFYLLMTSRTMLKTLEEGKEYSDKSFDKIFGENEKEKMERMGLIFRKGTNWMVVK